MTEKDKIINELRRENDDLKALLGAIVSEISNFAEQIMKVGEEGGLFEGEGETSD